MASGSSPNRGPYARNVRKAARYVLAQQQPNGLFAAPSEESRSMYGHGFGLLFLGLGLLKDAVPDADTVKEQAANFQGFIESLGGRGYFSYLIFLVIGVILTLIVQSSSAAIAITVTFAMNGWI